MRTNRRSLVGVIVVSVLVGLYLVFTLFPFYWMLNTALKSNQSAYNIPPQFYPHEPVLANFTRLFGEDAAIIRFFFNSLVIGFGTVAVCLIAGTLAGYSLSRFKLRFKRILLAMILMSQMFPRALLLIPIYVYAVEVKIFDTYWALIIADSAMALPYCVWLMKGYIDTIPREIEDAAKIDG